MGISLADVSLVGEIGGAALSVLGAYDKSKDNEKAYEYNAAVAANNAKFARMRADDAIARGQTAEDTQRLKTAQLKGKQRALLAAHGVALDEGSPLNILNDTDYMGEHDALVIRDNAAREAWALKQQASNDIDQSKLMTARADDESPWMNAAGTLLSKGGQVADSWYKYNKTQSVT